MYYILSELFPPLLLSDKVDLRKRQVETTRSRRNISDAQYCQKDIKQVSRAYFSLTNK